MDEEQIIVQEKDSQEKQNPQPPPNQLGNEIDEKTKAHIKPKIQKIPYLNVQDLYSQQRVEYKPAEVNSLFQKQNLFNKEDNYLRKTVLQDLESLWDINKQDLLNEKFLQANRKQDQNLENLYQNSRYFNVCGGDLVQSTDRDQFADQIIKQINKFQQLQEHQEIVGEDLQVKVYLITDKTIRRYIFSGHNIQINNQQTIQFSQQELTSNNSIIRQQQRIQTNFTYQIIMIRTIQLEDVHSSQIRQSILNFFSQNYSLSYNNQEENLEKFIIEIFKHHFRNQNPQKYIQIFDRKYLSVKQNVDFLNKRFKTNLIIQLQLHQIEDFFLELNNNERQINYTDNSTIEQIKNKISQFFQDCFDLRKSETKKIEPQILIKSGEINQSIICNQPIQTLKEFIYEIFQRFFSFQSVQKHQPLKVKSTLQIRKLQNGNIIHLFENKSKLYCNYQFDHQLKILKRDGFSTEQVVYEGNLDQYDQPHNQGILENPQWRYEGQFHQGFFHGDGKFEYKGVYIIDGQFIDGNAEGEDCIQYFSKSDPSGKEFHIKGKFQRGLKQGSFQCSLVNCQQLAFDNDKQIEVQKPQSKSYPFREYGNIGVQFIDQKCFETTLDSRWMQQKVVDFYLISLWSDLSLITDLSHINLINTCNAQDIFGSVIRQYNLNIDEIQKQIRKFENIKRTIIALNMNQQHFMACVYENNKFYLLDSICGSNYPALLVNLNEIFKPNHPIQFQTKLNISYQPNGYDFIKIPQYQY
ncbi:hypothetical protein pb186bvf_004820 [Paramecium bursaria]